MAFDPTQVARSKDGIYHPAREQIAPLVKYCLDHRKQLRVRGAGRSVDASIYTDRFVADSFAPNDVVIMLDKVTKLTIEPGNKVRVEGGCHLGLDPWDIAHQSTWENSLNWQLAQAGLALPDTGGISHQTVAGFMSTGSTGGSMQHSFYDALEEITFVDGTGTERTVSKVTEPDLFYAAGVSMGLLGVIVEVVLAAEPMFWVRGQQATTKAVDCAIDLFSDRGLSDFFLDREYSRLMWWPEIGAEKMVVWEAKRTGKPEQIIPYVALPTFLGNEQIVEAAGGLILRLFGTWPLWYEATFGTSVPAKLLEKTIDELYPSFLLPAAINSFIRTDKNGPKPFAETWWKGLTTDDQVSEVLLPAHLSELYLPIERTGEAMRLLRGHYERHGIDATGTLNCEIYAQKESPFWLSPTYQRPSVRFDFAYFERNLGSPSAYFQQFWDLLTPFGYRPHWGKWMPIEPANLAARYPRWDDFLSLRKQCDPQGVFLTMYWRDRFGL